MLVSGNLQTLDYVYDAVGNIRSIVDTQTPETLSYTYDALNRLRGVSGALSESAGAARGRFNLYGFGTGSMVALRIVYRSTCGFRWIARILSPSIKMPCVFVRNLPPLLSPTSNTTVVSELFAVVDFSKLILS
jgi:hypothetical protein